MGRDGKQELLPRAAGLVGLPSLMPRQAGTHAPRNSKTDEDDDSQDYGYSHGYSAAEIEQNALNIHRDSVNLVGAVCKVTLVSSLVPGLFWK